MNQLTDAERDELMSIVLQLPEHALNDAPMTTRLWFWVRTLALDWPRALEYRRAYRHMRHWQRQHMLP